MELEVDNKEQRRSKTEDKEATGPKQAKATQNENDVQCRLHLILHFTVINQVICVYFTHYIRRIHTVYKQTNAADIATAHKLFHSTTMHYFSMALLPTQIHGVNSE